VGRGVGAKMILFAFLSIVAAIIVVIVLNGG
jgi:hypothetical protein